MGGKTGKAILGAVLIGASFLVPGLGLGAYLTSALTGALIAQGSGMLLQAFYGASLDNRQQGIEINSANPSAPLPVVYGKTRIGLRLIDMRQKGKSLYIVGALCHGSEDGSGIAGIDEIYFNDRLAFDAAGTAQEGVAKRTENLPNQPGPGNTPTVVAQCVVTKYLGTDAQTADPTMISNFPADWNSDCRGRGVAYVVIELRWHEKLFPSGIPNIVCVVRGNKVYDPRSATTGYSTNPMLHARDYLRSTRYGVAAETSELDDIAFQAMANHCDELITVPGKYVDASFRRITAATMASPCEITTETNHGRTTGDRISIGVNGGTGINGLVGEWTIVVTAPNKMTLTGSSTSGPGYVANSCAMVAMVQQKRFESNGWLDVSRDPRDNLSDLLTACRGNLVYANGVYSPFIRRSVTPTTVIAITEDNILSDFSFSDQGIKDAPNLARVKFINPLKSYAPDEIQWPRPGVTNTYLTEDGGFESATDLNLPFTQDRVMAQQIGMVTLREGRGAIVAEMVVNEQGLLLAVGDVVPVSHSTPGWSAKPFWVMGTAIVGSHSVKLTLLEYTSGAYSLDEQQLTLGDPDTLLPDPTVSGPPTSVVASNSSVTGTDGSVVNTLTLTWVAPTTDANPNLDHYQIRYKQDFESEWRPAPDPKLTDLQAVFPGVGVGTWYIQIRAINAIGTSSDWVQASIVVAGGGGTGGSTPATVAGFTASFVSGNIEAKWNANTEADLAGYEVRHGGANWGASTFLAKVDATKFTLLKQYITQRSYTLRIKPFTRSGTYSASDATVAVSQPVPDAAAVGGGDITVESRLGKLKVFVNLTGTHATQARLYASISSGFGPVVADRYAERAGLIDSDRAVFEFTLPTLWFGATVYCKIGLKDELSDQLAEAEQFTSQFSIVGKRVFLDDDVDDGTIFKRTLEVERNSTWKSGENLVANPSGEAGDHRGWKFLSPASSNVPTTADNIVEPVSPAAGTIAIVDDDLLPAGVKALEFAGDGRVFIGGELLPVETSLRYVHTAWARQAVVGGGSPKMYLGLAPYTKDGIRISPQMYFHPGNVTTTLAADVAPGHTTITLTDASGFPDESGSSFNTFIALNVDVAGKTDIPNVTVLRYTSKAGNVLTLTQAVPAGISALSGSSVRFHRAGGNYIYCSAVNVTLPTANYQEYTGAVEGEMTMTEAMSGVSSTKFWPGTRYVRAFLIANSGGTGATSRARVSRTTFYQAVRDRDVKDIGASKLGSGSDLSLPSVIKESGGKLVNRLLAKPNAADPDHIDSVPDGATYGKPKLTALTGGEVDLGKAGVINKVAANIKRVAAGAGLDAIVAKMTDIGELTRSQRLEGQDRTLIQGMDSYIPNAGFEVWESASQPHAWTVNTTGGATVAKETTIKFSGDSSLKYVLPASASWQGINTNDPTVGGYCIPLKPGRTYRFRVASRASRVAEGQKYRLFLESGAWTASQEFTYGVVDAWQGNEWTVTTPTTLGATTRLSVEFNQNGYAGGTVNCYLDQVELVEIESQTYLDNGTKTGDFTIDWAKGDRQRVKVNSSTGIAITMANPTPGQLVVLAVEQASNYPYRWNTSNISWAAVDGVPIPTRVPGHQDIYVFFYDSRDSKWRCVAASTDHSDIDVQVSIGRCRLGANLNDTVAIATDFMPKAGMFFWNDLTGTGNADRYGIANDFGWGFMSYDGTNLFQTSVGAHVQNGAGTANVSSCQRHAAIVATIDDANAIDGIGTVDSVSKVGLVLKTTDAFPANKNPFVSYILFGGNAVQAQCGWFSVSAGTGNKAITGVGFKPNSVFIIGIGTTTTTDTVVAALSPWFGGTCDGGGGAHTGAVHTIFAQDNVGTDNTRSGFSSPAIILHRNNSDVDDLVGTLSTFDTDGFTLNLSTNSLGASNQMFLALKGVQCKMWPDWITQQDDEFRFEEYNMTPIAVLTVHDHHLPSESGTVWKDHGHLGFGAAVRNIRSSVPSNTVYGNIGAKQWAQSVFINDSPASGSTEVRQAKSVVAAVYKLQTATTAAITEKISVDRWEAPGPVMKPETMAQDLIVSRFIFGVP